MTDIGMLKRQKEREIAWTDAGRDRFMAHVRRQDGADNPAARGLMKEALEAAIGALTNHVAMSNTQAHPGRDRVIPVLDCLGAEHVAILAVRCALNAALSIGSRGGRLSGHLTPVADVLGQALEHDMRFSIWASDKTQKVAVRKFREDLVAHPKAIQRRLKRLREAVDSPWDHTDLVMTGMDVLHLITDGSAVFVTPNVRIGGKTIRMLKLTDATMATLSHREDMLAVNSPRWSLMIVPPRPWQYVEAPDARS